MHAMGGRLIHPEILDDLPLEQKRDSLRDLTRLNQQSGRRPLRRLLAEAVPEGSPFSLLDVGAASGDMGAYIASLYPGVRVTSLDYRQEHLESAPQTRVVAEASRLPFGSRSFDYVFSSLFLHHFSNGAVVQLLSEMGRVARHGVLALDLYRHPIAYYFVPATQWLFGWDPITVHDAPISVEAAFRPSELAELAEKAGLHGPQVRSYGWSFRVSLHARVSE
jgi:ubiquinone/menaquinone biosynthesis C-methylase UbiE